MKDKILVVAEQYTDIYTKTQNWLNLADLALQDLDRGIPILSIGCICLYSFFIFLIIWRKPECTNMSFNASQLLVVEALLWLGELIILLEEYIYFFQSISLPCRTLRGVYRFFSMGNNCHLYGWLWSNHLQNMRVQGFSGDLHSK